MEFHITVLPGDGIGPEVVAEGVRVLDAVGGRFHHAFHYHHGLVGGAAIDATGSPLPSEVLEICFQSDAILFGAVGGPRWDQPGRTPRPEDGLLALRKRLGLFANIRPVKAYPSLAGVTSVKEEVLSGVDLVILRELTGGLYFGRPKRRWSTARGRRAVDTLRYSEKEIVRIARIGFEMAQCRRKVLTSVDKANVLESSRLWREVVTELGQEYPDVALNHMLVDTCAMQLIRAPRAFDVIITENTFGDILTDEASVLAGSIGLLPSASLGARWNRRRRPPTQLGLYEPIHGSAPDIAGQSVANPIGCILSVAMLLRLSLGLEEAAAAVEQAVERVLQQGYRTRDTYLKGATLVRTKEMGQWIAQAVG